MIEQCWEPNLNKIFLDLWRDNFLQVTGQVACCSLCWLNVEPYSWALFKRGLESWVKENDGEEDEVLDKAMEYTGVVAVEVTNMLMSVNKRLREIEPQVLAQQMFRGNGLQNFIHDHQDRLEHIEGQLGDLTIMVDHTIHRQDITLESYHQDLWQVERLNSELLVWVAALEHSRGNLILIDSPELIPVPPLGGLG